MQSSSLWQWDFSVEKAISSNANRDRFRMCNCHEVAICKWKANRSCWKENCLIIKERRENQIFWKRFHLFLLSYPPSSPPPILVGIVEGSRWHAIKVFFSYLFSLEHKLGERRRAKKRKARIIKYRSAPPRMIYDRDVIYAYVARRRWLI